MKLSKKIFNKVIEDNDFSLEMAKRLQITQWAVIQRAKRKSRTLMLPECIAFYKEQGFIEEDIFEKEEVEKN
ncbi:hypothetical protein [Capnocytophaga canis]|uniref:hypothetical protein n=1 Tax=Capnocytophaga canis TaxID=1848903 RepID=UPI001561E7CB|nr:hypothetical protein [Capnocytophaga canis]